MFETYLNEDSNLEINVSRILKKKFMDQYFESEVNEFISDDIFDDLLGEVIDSVFVDSFPRFERSFIFQDWEIEMSNEKN